jgi:hypothetical protein
MSLDLVSTHTRIHHDIHSMAEIMAGVAGIPVATYISQAVEKAIVGEFHVLSMQAEKISRLGLSGISRDLKGFSGIQRGKSEK